MAIISLSLIQTWLVGAKTVKGGQVSHVIGVLLDSILNVSIATTLVESLARLWIVSEEITTNRRAVFIELGLEELTGFFGTYIICRPCRPSLV